MTDYSWYTQDELLNLAYDSKVVAKMSKDDTLSLVRELANRLQRTTDELQRAVR